MKKENNIALFLMVFVFVIIALFQTCDLDKVYNFYFPKKYSLTAEELKYIPPQNQNFSQSPTSNSNDTQYESNAKNYENAYNQKDYKTAVFYGEKIAYYYTDNADFLDAMGYAYLELKDYKNATIYYNKTLSIDPNNKYAKQNLEYIEYQVNQNKETNELNKLHSSVHAPAKLYALVKTDLGNDIKQKVYNIFDVLWQEVNARIILQTVMDRNIPIKITADGQRAYTAVHGEGYKVIVDEIDIPVKYINNLNNTNLQPYQRIYYFNVFMHEFGHAFSSLRNPKYSDSIEEEMGVDMIGYNIGYKMVYHRYMTYQEVKQQSMDTLQALLSDDHAQFPVYSGFNKRMQSYAVYMPNPELYTNLVAMYKQLLAQGKTQHVPNFDKLIK